MFNRVFMKQALVVSLLVSTNAFAQSALTTNQFIGKWQCHTKHNDPLIHQENILQFLKNGEMRESVSISYGQKSAYAYQIEKATAHSKWSIKNNTLHYDNHQFYHYGVRMPNADKNDIYQANVALQKSLPMIQDMMNDDIHQRHFDVSFINKNSFIMNDVDNQRLMTCHKKGLFGF